MKKLMLLLIVYSLAAGTAVSVFAADDTDTSSTNDIVITMQIGNPEMTVNGSVREINPGAGSVPVIENDRTLLPVRAVIEALGGTIEWNGDTRTATLTYGSDVIELTIDNVTAYLNGTPQTLDTAPVIINDRTMLPIRFISESFRFEVEWEASTQTITITNTTQVETVPTSAPTTSPSPSPSPTPSPSPEPTSSPSADLPITNGVATPPPPTTAPTETPTATMNPYLGDYDPDAGYDFDLNVEEELSAEENEALAEEEQNQ
ncbi:MAG TPA: copper amine oxidase N-terminal domain-containing protein [Candidatus Ornithomonoglobus merdipullorum]|uniref:Copper amine oxidase N-terminal domain-containing protein n=1 Tax=Candidatus Ornithomonoglobus merdipullorum TaxID=2840895 RepID=A0A9D1MAS2_9FIRM|nr:copper amine oxidase N-terminal domain-containing protein [Candidatus Ornithomonoglobus merdipullorum]